MSTDGMLQDLATAREEWERETLTSSLEATPERMDEFATGSGEFTVARVYSPLDLRELDYGRDLGFPGQYPYTRGTEPSMYRSSLWHILHYVGFGTPEATNLRFKRLMEEEGYRTLYVALDLPTQIGYDADHPLAKGHVGTTGVSINSLRDFEILFDGIELEKTRIAMVANSIGPIALAFLIALAEKRGTPLSAMNVSLQNDPLKEFLGSGRYIYPPEPSLKLSIDVIEYCARYVPHWHPIQVTVNIFRWGGCTAAQELGFGLANGLEYVERALQRGLDVDEFVHLMEFNFTADNDLFEEVAKLRAARRMWATLMRERYEPQDERSMKMNLYVYTSGVSMTAQQPYNNIVRTALHVLASVLGGAQYLGTPQFDEALGIPTLESAILALRTQQIIAYESGVTSTVDPLGGAYFVEALTNQMESAARRYLALVEDQGGALACVENGFLEAQMSAGAYRYEKAIESGQRVVVGLNKFRRDESPRVRPFRSDIDAENRQLSRLAELKRERDAIDVARALRELRRASKEPGNLILPILDAVKCYATVGEISDVLREEYGEHVKPPIF